jgi:hypothetical protein
MPPSSRSRRKRTPTSPILSAATSKTRKKDSQGSVVSNQ